MSSRNGEYSGRPGVGTVGGIVGEPSKDLAGRHDAVDRIRDAAASTAPLAFEGEVFGWADLPAATRRLARRDDHVLAERVVADDRLYDSPSGVVQVLRGWRAHPGAVVVAVVQRRVRADAFPLRPAGPWAHVSLHSFEAAATPRRRAGTVTSTLVTDHRGTQAGVASDPRHAAAQEAWAFLPAQVRASAERVVPVPDDWLGDLRQRSDAGQPASQDVVVLRRSASAAAVVVARRSAPELVGATVAELAQRLAREPWSVEQLSYDLRRPAQLGPTAPAGLPWE